MTTLQPKERLGEIPKPTISHHRRNVGSLRGKRSAKLKEIA